MIKLKPKEETVYKELLKEYYDFMRMGNKQGLYDLRKRCIEIFILDRGTEEYKEKILTIGFDCHQAMKYVNITGASEFLSIKDNPELEYKIGGYLDEADNVSKSE